MELPVFIFCFCRPTMEKKKPQTGTDVMCIAMFCSLLNVWCLCICMRVCGQASIVGAPHSVL